VSTPSAEEKDHLQEGLGPFLEQEDPTALREAVADLHPSDIADLVEELDEPDRLRILQALPAELASETLAEMDVEEHPEDILADLGPEVAAAIVQELEDDDAADLIGELEPHEADAILAALPEEEAGELRDLMAYGEETAGGLMTRDLVGITGDLSAAEAIVEVRRQGREVEDFYVVFVVDDQKMLLGTVPLDQLILADPHEQVANLIRPVLTSVTPDVDQEDVGRLMSRYNVPVLPVLSEDGRLLGRVTFDDVIDVIEAEQTEDILRLAGVSEEEEIRGEWHETVRARLPWLLLNLITASAAASVVRYYEGTIEDIVILAFLMPIIAALGGNAGTQSLAVTLRRIATSEERSFHGREVVGKELLVGVVNGALLGVGIAVLAVLVGGNPGLGGVVMLAMWGNLMLAGFAGAFIPTLLDRMGVDPAVASSVFLHTITDFCGFLLLLGLATRFLL
jgi:magnesium transporter